MLNPKNFGVPTMLLKFPLYNSLRKNNLNPEKIFNRTFLGSVKSHPYYIELKTSTLLKWKTVCFTKALFFNVQKEEKTCL